MGSISSLLHTLQVSWNAACSIFRHVWTGFSAVRLPPSLLAVSPSVSLPLAGPGSLKWRPNINICHTDGKEEVQLSLTSSFFPRFSSSVTCLLISYCFLPPHHPHHRHAYWRLSALLFTSLTPLFSACCDIWPHPVDLRLWNLLIQDGISLSLFSLYLVAMAPFSG